MKAAKPSAPVRVRAKVLGKSSRRKVKKSCDLSWLLDRSLPPGSELLENYVIVMRNRQ